MRRSTFILSLGLVALAVTAVAPVGLQAQDQGTEIGEMVPEFTLPDTYGN
ncbi:MAG: hypothetical protein HKO65_18275, partial [Gemmatimonadetes bacterium]|nr:hypothetical protein [Gemmatimonadota bacterium]